MHTSCLRTPMTITDLTGYSATKYCPICCGVRASWTSVAAWASLLEATKGSRSCPGGLSCSKRGWKVVPETAPVCRPPNPMPWNTKDKLQPVSCSQGLCYATRLRYFRRSWHWRRRVARGVFRCERQCGWAWRVRSWPHRTAPRWRPSPRSQVSQKASAPLWNRRPVRRPACPGLRVSSCWLQPGRRWWRVVVVVRLWQSCW